MYLVLQYQPYYRIHQLLKVLQTTVKLALASKIVIQNQITPHLYNRRMILPAFSLFFYQKLEKKCAGVVWYDDKKKKILSNPSTFQETMWLNISKGTGCQKTTFCVTGMQRQIISKYRPKTNFDISYILEHSILNL